MDRFEDIMMAAFMLIFALIGITEIVGFLLTLMWHCLLFAAMSLGMVWVWYKEDYQSKGKSLSTLWQKKNTKN